MARSAVSTSSTSKRGRRPRAQRAAGERRLRGQTRLAPPAALIDVRRVRLARVVGAHGLEGELRVSLHGADPECFERVRTLWLAGADSDAGARAHELTDVAPGTRRGECRLRLAGIADRDAAEAARGFWLWARA